ncbi:MAG: hypothetical protein ACLFUK_04590 [Halanaerobium sp.]
MGKPFPSKIGLLILNINPPPEAARKNIALLNKNLYQIKLLFLKFIFTVPNAAIIPTKKGFNNTKATIKTGRFIEVVISVIELKSKLKLLTKSKVNNKKNILNKSKLKIYS